MKLFRNSVFAMLVLAAGTFGQQGKPSTVEVSQEYLNSSSKAFEEVVLLRTAAAALQRALDAEAAASKAKDELTGLQKTVIESQARELKVKDEQIAIYKKMNCDKSIFLFIFKKVRCK